MQWHPGVPLNIFISFYLKYYFKAIAMSQYHQVTINLGDCVWFSFLKSSSFKDE